MEEWKPVVYCDNYEISNKGKLRNKFTGLILKTAVDRYGYEKVHIVKSDKSNYFTTIHRLVALAWLDNNDDNKLQVNHIDGNKLNNELSNLEWVSARENINHSYGALLNTNVSPVILNDLEKGYSTEFKSIKELSKHLGINVSILSPYIKNSNTNPILGRYSITVKDENAMFSRSNTLEFGKEIHIYDVINETMTTYPSINVAAYFTGLKCLTNVNEITPYSKAGYQISFDISNLPINVDCDKKELLEEREQYLNQLYRKRNPKYYIYDYYKREETIFEKNTQVCDFLNQQEPLIRVVNVNVISSLLGKSLKRNALIKGFGLKSDFRNFNWYQYTEEQILRNKYNRAGNNIYRVKTDKDNKIIFGIFELINYLGYRTDKLIRDIDINEVLLACDIPNLSVTRLNKPIP